MTTDRQALLRARLAQKGVALQPATGAGPALTPRPAGAAPVMSFAQERLWFVQQLQPTNTAYHLGEVFALRGPLDEAALRRAFADVVARHEVLRTSFREVDGKGSCVIASADDGSVLQAADISQLPPAAQEETVAAQADELLATPFDLSRPPLLRARLLRLAAEDHRLIFFVHHIAFDGWSIDVLVRELGARYTGAVLPPLKLHYADYAQWQRERAWQPEWQEALTRWTERLAGTPVLNLPTDHPRPAALTGRGSVHRFAVPAALAAALRKLAQDEGATTFMVLLAAWQTFLGRYAGQTDFAVGSPVANRPETALEDLIGFFVNMVALRTDQSDDPDFRTYLRRTAVNARDVFADQETPFEQIVDRLQLRRDPSRHPVFQVGFSFQNEPSAPVKLAGLNLTTVPSPVTAAKFDVLLAVTDDPRGGPLTALLEFSTELFAPTTMALWAENLLTLLGGIVVAPETALSRLPLVSAAERASWPPAPVARAEPAGRDTLVAWFNATAAAQPDRVAVTDQAHSLTYGELAARSDQLAYSLLGDGVGADRLVAIAMERSVHVLVAILGTLKAGGAYLPIDPAYPADRQEFMLRDAAAVVLLTDRTLRDRVAVPAELPVRVIDADWDVIAATDPVDLPVTAAEDTAYVIYTSGSTGRPKGVPVTHRNVTRLFTQTDHWFGFGPDDVWTLFHSFAFDFSVWEIWGALLYGGRLVVVPFTVSRAVDRFHRLLVDERVTVLSQTPSAFRQLVAHEESAGNAPAALALRWVVFGGEALDLPMLAPWVARHGDREPRLVNMYGITETTVHVTYRELTAADIAAGKGSVIGEPIPDLTVHLLDAHLQPVPRGVAGEIVVGGAGLARGYLNRPELTAERFVAHPLAGSGGRLYRSGDSARRLANGDLEYLGRIDFQVKVRGFRIELGEIESALSRHDAIRGAVVLAQRADDGETRLAAWLVAAGSTRPSLEALRTHLKAFLPDYMVPASFTWLEAFPLTPNGKVDRTALPQLAGERAATAGEVVAPATPREQVLVEVWAGVLGADTVGVTDNFFALGGDSIRSIEVRSATRKRGFDFPLQALFQHQTVRELAVVLEPLTTTATVAPGAFALLEAADRARLPAEVVDAYPLSALQAGMLFHAELHPEAPVYHDLFSYHLRMAWSEDALRAALDAVTARHAILRTSLHPQGFSEPVQCVHATGQVPLQVFDLRAQMAAEQEQSLATYREAQKAARFDWTRAPLLRVAVHRRSDATVQVTLTLHHAILDGWSLSSLLAELFTDYAERVAGRIGPTGAPPPAFRDFIALEREVLASAASRAFWLSELEDPPAARLPRRTGRASAEVPAQDAVFHTWTGDTLRPLRALAAQAGVGLKHLLLAAHAKVVAHHAGAREVVTGVITNGRPEDDGATATLGLFLNTVPYRLPVAPGTWTDLLQAALATEQRLLPHRRMPLFELQKATGRAALFETSFNYINFHVLDAIRARTDLEVLEAEFFDQNSFAYFAQFSGDHLNDQLELELRFDPAEFTREQVADFVAAYDRVFAAMATEGAAQARHEIASYLSPAEFTQVVHTANAAPLPSGGTPRLQDGFLAQAVRQPDAVALIAGATRVTYGELLTRVRAGAAHLRAQGVGPEHLVGVCLERGVDLVASLLAVLEAGAAYVPLDPSYPAERVAFMCEDARVAVLISRPALAERLPAGLWTLVEPTTLFAPPAPGSAAVPADPANLAYLIYTSGSTGRPKATAIEHRQAAALVAWARAEFTADDLTGVLFATSVCFDLSVFELFVPLAVGGTVIVADNALALSELPERDAVTLVNTVPSAAAELVRQGAFPRNVRVVNLAGEPLSAALADRIYETTTASRVCDLYGPSEDTTYSTWTTRERGGPETIGRVLPGSQLYLLDDDLQPVPIGAVGEIYLGGTKVARGYLGRPDLTAERFLPDPFAATPGARFYRTGDLARRRADGRLEFLGRRDQQVKLRGFRIELGEIKAVLEQHPEVKEAAVLARDDAPGGGKRLVAYVAGAGWGGSAGWETPLRGWLSERLPEYFVPAVFVALEQLPLTPNGKLDRKALPAPPDPTDQIADPASAPRTELEAQLAQIWADVLKVPQVGVHDNYFALGGDSIQVLQLVSRAREAGLGLSPRAVFERPTVAELARGLESAAPATAATQPVEDLAGDLELTPIQRWFFAQHFADAHHWNQTVLLEAREAMDPTRLERALRQVVAHHPLLRARFQCGEDGAWVARVAPPDESAFAFQVVPFAEASEISAVCAAEQRRLDLAAGPLMRAVWFAPRGPGAGRLFIVIHHLVVDGVSWRVLLADLLAAYRGAATLPPVTRSASGWARHLHGLLDSSALAAEAKHWQTLAAAPVSALPRDFPGGANTADTTATVKVELTAAETQTLLREALGAYRCQINDLLLTALALALRDWTGAAAHTVNLEGHGRENLDTDIDLSRSVGWFTALYPQRLDLAGVDVTAPAAAVPAIAAQLAAVPRRGLGYGIGRWLASPPRWEVPAAELCFNYLGQFDDLVSADAPFGPAAEDVGPQVAPASERAHLIDVAGLVADGTLRFEWLYGSALHRPETIAAVAEGFLRHLRALLAAASEGSAKAVAPTGTGANAARFDLADLSDDDLDEAIEEIEF